MANPAAPKKATAKAVVNKAANAAFSLDDYLAEGGNGSQTVTAIRKTPRGNLVVLLADKEFSMFRKTLEKSLKDGTFTKKGNDITAKGGFRQDQGILWPKGTFNAADVI